MVKAGSDEQRKQAVVKAANLIESTHFYNPKYKVDLLTYFGELFRKSRTAK